MSYKVWRRLSDHSVVGFCEATYDGFVPGGDPKTSTMTIETSAPPIPPAGPTPIQQKVTAALADPSVPHSVKDALVALQG